MKKTIFILLILIIGLLLFGCIESFQEGFEQGAKDQEPQFIDCGTIKSTSDANGPEVQCLTNLMTVCSPGKAIVDLEKYSIVYLVEGIKETCDFKMETKIGADTLSITTCKVPPLKMLYNKDNLDDYCETITNEENVEKYDGKTEGFSGFRVDYFEISGYENDPNFAQFSTSIVNEGTSFVGVDYRKIFFEKNGKQCKGRIYRTLGVIQSDGNLVKLSPSHVATFSGVIFGEECGLTEPSFEYKVFFDINNIQNGNPAGKVEGTVSGTYLQPSDLYNYYSDKCWIQRINDDYYSALENCTKAFEMGPRNYNVIDDLFVLYKYELVDYYGCIEFGKKAIEAVPNRPDNYYGVGACYQNLEDYNNARSYYQKALDLSPIHELARRGLIATYKFIEKDYEKMHELVDEGLDLNPNSLNMLHLKGIVYYYEKNWAKCKEWLYKAQTIDPNWEQNNKFITYCEEEHW